MHDVECCWVGHIAAAATNSTYKPTASASQLNAWTVLCPWLLCRWLPSNNMREFPEAVCSLPALEWL